MPTFEYKADAATPCLTLIPAPVTLEYTHGTAMIGSLVTIEKRIPEYAVTEDADETWETLPIEQLSSELERYCGVAVRTRRVLTATDEAVMMIKNNDADGMVSGAVHSTGDTLRPALERPEHAPVRARVRRQR